MAKDGNRQGEKVLKQLIGLVAVARFCIFLLVTLTLAISLDFVPASQPVGVGDVLTKGGIKWIK